MRHAVMRAIGVLAIAAILAGCGTTIPSGLPTLPAGSGIGAGASPSTGEAAAAEAYCTSKGGQLVDRVATWNTNADPSAWLQLAGRQRFCEFESGTGDEATRISVDLVTLYSESPTLAAVAYLSKVPTPQPPQVGQNPAEYACSNGLEGAAAFGNTASGGGWVDTTQKTFVVMDMCVFADGSAIDEFGIWYYANGTVRGADLAPILRYQPGDKLPAIYEKTRR
jgi:putative hemolysin